MPTLFEKIEIIFLAVILMAALTISITSCCKLHSQPDQNGKEQKETVDLFDEVQFITIPPEASE